MTLYKNASTNGKEERKKNKKKTVSGEETGNGLELI